MAFSKLSKQQKRMLIGCFAASFLAMDALLGSTIFAYLCQDYADVPHSSLALWLSLSPIVAVVTAFLLGPISMKISKKAITIFGISLMMISGGVYYFGGGRVSYGVMLFCAAIDGLESCIVTCMPQAYVMTSFDSIRDRGRYSGQLNSWVMIGSLCFTVIGGALGARFGWQHSYVLYLLSVPAMILVILFMPSDKPSERKESQQGNVSLREFVRVLSPGMLVIYVFYFLFFAVSFTFNTTISQYVITEFHLGTSYHAGIASALTTLAGILTGMSFAMFAHRLRRWVAPLLTLLITLGYVSMSIFTSTLMGCMLGAVLIGLAKGGVTPYIIGKVSGRVPPMLISTVTCVTVACMNLGMAVSNNIINPLALAVSETISIPSRIKATILLGAVALVISVIYFVFIDDNYKTLLNGHYDPH